VKAADNCVAYFNDLLFEDYWPEDNDDEPSASPSQPLTNQPSFEDRMRRHVQHFVESYIGEPQKTPLGQQEVLDIIGYFEELVRKSYQVRFNDDADEA
jgi:hypothetical protein